jgi:hypothetical protein
MVRAYFPLKPEQPAYPSPSRTKPHPFPPSLGLPLSPLTFSLSPTPLSPPTSFAPALPNPTASGQLSPLPPHAVAFNYTSCRRSRACVVSDLRWLSCRRCEKDLRRSSRPPAQSLCCLRSNQASTPNLTKLFSSATTKAAPAKASSVANMAAPTPAFHHRPLLAPCSSL